MNRLTLRHRLLLLTLLPSALIAIVLVIYFTLTAVDTLEGELHQKGLSMVRHLAPVSEFGIISGQTDSLQALAQASVQETGVKAMVIINRKGRILAASGRVSLTPERLRQALSQPGEIVETPDWIAFGAPVIRSLNEADALFEPLLDSTETEINSLGQIFIELDKVELGKRQHELVLRGMGIVVFGLLMLVPLALAMANALATPVLRLVEAVRRMRQGELSVRVPTLSFGELGVLEQGFNEMADHLEEVHQSMQARIEEATAQLAYQARHDALTGLLNRREFDLQLERAVAAVQAGGEEFSLLFIDLDRFKQVNDQCGHLAGDELLRQVARLFSGRLRENDLLARLGGDEFGIILSGCTGFPAQQVANDLCELTAAYRFICQDKVFSIGASIGLTAATRQLRNMNELVAAADGACHRAKESGRNQVCVTTVQQAPERRQEGSNWAARIRSALSDDRLHIQTLPLHRLQTAGIFGPVIELTAELIEPDQPPIALSALIEAAQRYDFAGIIDQRLVDAAIDTLSQSAARQRPLHCIVPISSATIENPGFMDRLADRLALAGMNARGLLIMLPEELISRHMPAVKEFSERLQQLGGRLVLDDVGGGFASFSHLRNLAPWGIKLSRSLTSDLSGNRASTALLRAVQEVTADLGILSIASDVLTPEDLESLKTLGVDYAEGRLILPAIALEQWRQSFLEKPPVDAA
ncbi:MAG: diguanylate cyclase [Azonexus sp.]|nr:diguanylate cyclase [Azonexus sp.]